MANTTSVTAYRIPLPPSPPNSPSSIQHSRTMIPTPDQRPNNPGRSPNIGSAFGSSTSIHKASEGPKCGTQRHRGQSDPVPQKPRLASDKGESRRRPTAKLDDFQLIRVLGTGCAGRVLLVKHTQTSGIHAMKAISKRSVLTYDELFHTLTEQAILKRFAVEEPGNAFITRLHHSFTDRENFYFVMDFYPGGDLATQMEIHGLLGHHRTRFYAADIVYGLEHLHRHGIVMRDLKPENVLLNASGHAVLADFGLAKQFPYRGDAKGIHVEWVSGQPPLREWAGAGVGSSRLQPDGSTKLAMDWAHSFAPEVIKHGGYSYGVDWWAFGCIVLEGLIGRTPYKIREDEEPVVLYNKILIDPWDGVFQESPFCRRPLMDYGLDPTTIDFVDALLAKDPMWRLTEPFVKRHAYFSFIDWETVRKGEYEDPHGLQLHPITEYNTRYFPILCLEEEPTVDMTPHTPRLSEQQRLTPLNDNRLYALELAKHRTELEAFNWSKDLYEQSQMTEDEGEGSENKDGPRERTNVNRGGDTNMILSSPLEDVLELATVESKPQEGVPRESKQDHTQQVMQPVTRDEGKQSLYDSAAYADVTKTPPIHAYSHLSTRSPESTSAATTLPPLSPPLLVLPLASDIVHKAKPSAEPITIQQGPSTNTNDAQNLALPTGFPASGLSVSDIVSVPSFSVGSPHRLVRRHPALLGTESIPVARLSVELDGMITALDDEEWEDLSSEGIESMPNGHPRGAAPSSFLARGFGDILRRRSSTLFPPGLRSQPKSSDSSRDSSPTKSRPMASPGMIASKSIESTKRAFGRLKTFPKLKKGGEGKVSPFVMVSPSNAVNVACDLLSTPQSRPPNLRRHTETGTGWLDKRPRLPKQGSASASRISKQGVSGSGLSMGDASEAELSRVELVPTPPVAWELGGKDGV